MLMQASYCLGPFLVGLDGGLMPPTDRSANFSVRWRSRTVFAEMRAAEGDKPEGDKTDADRAVTLSMQAALGWVPSTAAAGAEVRAAGLALAQSLAATARPGFALALSADHRVMLRAERRLPVPVTARRLVAEAADFLLEAAPYLDLIAGDSPVEAGRANTWPG